MVISVQCFGFPIYPCFLCYCDDSRCMYRMMDITLDPTRVLHLTSVQHPPKKSQEKPITKENCFFVQITHFLEFFVTQWRNICIQE